MLTKTTACSRDCPDTCTLVVEVDEAGKATKLRGSADDPVTQGFLCERTSRFLDRQNSPERFTTPMWRAHKGAALEPVSWEFAMDLCAQRLLQCREQSGAASIMHYRSGGSLGLLKQISELLFETFGPVTLKRGDICSGAGEAAQELDFGVCDSHDLFDIQHSKHIFLWGKNIHTMGPHLLPLLMKAKQAGAKLYGIDPVRTRQSGLVDHFIQPNPGCDFALAMAISWTVLEHPPQPHPQTYCDHYEAFGKMVRARSQQEWADIAGVCLAQVKVLADALCDQPACIQVGWGLGRRRNGGATIRALDALAAISGNLGIAGGGVSYYFRRRGAYDCLQLGGLDVAPRSFSEACLGQEMLAAKEPLVRFLWVTAGNPASMLPDSESVRRAFAQVETVVVVDTHPTDTTDLADLVLPTLTLLEDDDLLGAYGNHYLRVSQPAVAPPGEARHELWIWQQMASRLGLGDLLEGTPQDWKQRMMGRLNGVGVGLENLARGPVLNPFAEKLLFADRHFPTPNGKMQLVFQEPSFPSTNGDFPLLLAAFSTPKAQASQWSVAPPAIPVARVHPSSAGGLQHGQTARLETRLGGLTVQVQCDKSLHPRLVLLDKGGMLRLGGSPNSLLPAHETDIGGGASYYDEPARLSQPPLE
ncbi:molybdopterin-dependent oxidoreductase [bacterium]|nr:molybdopterin-dependent oxidoreductase [bacterium]